MREIIETERTILRELTQNDYWDLCEIMQDAETMYAYAHAFTDAEVHNWLNRQIERYEKHGFGLWAVIEKQTQSFIGQVGLTYQDVEGKQELEIGYLLKRKYWHKGYATESAIACRDYAFNCLAKNRVVSIIRDTTGALASVVNRVTFYLYLCKRCLRFLYDVGTQCRLLQRKGLWRSGI